jgi:DNA mismatch repair protein MutS2
MKYFIKNANSETLFLIDEFGTGTEPQLGASIAEATLEQLNKKQAFGVITTHYSNLKLAAERLEGLQNGAMLFDTEKMQPLYILKIGKPGSSFAFEIAKKIGFPSFVLQNAKKKSGGKHVRFDQQLQQLETDKLAIDKKQKQLDSADETLSELVEKYTSLLKDLSKTKKQIIEDAKQEASVIIENSNKAIEKTIREIKEAQANKEATKTIRKKLEEKKIQLKKEKTEDKEPEIIETDDELRMGDFVSVIDTDITGEIIIIEDDEALINVNDIKLRISLDKLEKSSAKQSQKTKRSSSASIIHEINKKVAHFELSIDLRGKRSEEALYLLQKYIDEALLLSMKEVSILHGKGFGILRDNIREYLRSVDEVKHFEDAPLNMGGTGITRVYFK